MKALDRLIAYIENNEHNDKNVNKSYLLKMLYEAKLEQCSIPVVVRQSEQLVCSCGSIKVHTTGGSQCPNNRCSSAN